MNGPLGSGGVLASSARRTQSGEQKVRPFEDDFVDAEWRGEQPVLEWGDQKGGTDELVR